MDDISAAGKGHGSKRKNGSSGASKQPAVKLPMDIHQSKRIRTKSPVDRRCKHHPFHFVKNLEGITLHWSWIWHHVETFKILPRPENYSMELRDPSMFLTCTSAKQHWRLFTHCVHTSHYLPRPHQEMFFHVFEGKINQLFEKVTQLDIFGSNRGIMKSVEEQERGLLHAHCMLWIVERPDMRDLEKIISPQFQIQHWPSST